MLIHTLKAFSPVKFPVKIGVPKTSKCFVLHFLSLPAPLLRGFLFTISASISATHRWMSVWNQKTVSAQRLSPPSHLRELSRLFRRRHAVRLYGSHLRPVRSARECCRGILPVSASFPLPCRRVLSRSQRLAACRARYLWGTSTGGGLWYSGPWPVFPAFPGVREAILFTYVNHVKKNVHHKKHIWRKKSRPVRAGSFAACSI